MSQRFSTLAGAALLAVGTIGLTLYWQWPTDTPVPVAAEVPAAAALEPIVTPPAAPAPIQAAVPGRRVSQPLVPGMADTEIDGELKTDAAGNLLFALGVRDYFDYFLSFADQAGLEASVGALVADASSRLQEPALGQLSRLLADYLDYKRASMALLQQPLSLQQQMQPEGRQMALRQAFDSLAQLRREHLSAAAVEAFFGAEEAYAHYTLDSIALLAREDLDPAAKAGAVEALRAQLPEAMRASETRQAQAQSQQIEAERLWREGAGEEEVRQFLGMTYDPPTVERLLAEQNAERAWQQRYAGYREELLALKSSGLAAADREREAQSLRQRLFDAEGLHRVETYDAIAAKQEPSASAGP